MMFNLKRKEKMSEVEKSILRHVMMIYELNNDIFTYYSNNQEKRQIISNLFKRLNYDAVPKLYSNCKDCDNGMLIYRGISANNTKLLKKYVNDFLNGDVFFGGNGAIYGTGIYTVIGDKNIANDYSNDGGTSNFGIMLEGKMLDNTKIIEYGKIEEIRDFLIKNLKRVYKNNNMDNFISLLDDDGVLSAILGYDAIHVNKKNYLVVLNRGKIIINDIDLYNKMNFTDENHISNIK